MSDVKFYILIGHIWLATCSLAYDTKFLPAVMLVFYAVVIIYQGLKKEPAEKQP